MSVLLSQKGQYLTAESPDIFTDPGAKPPGKRKTERREWRQKGKREINLLPLYLPVPRNL
jgi:hypothetical protein